MLSLDDMYEENGYYILNGCFDSKDFDAFCNIAKQHNMKVIFEFIYANDSYRCILYEDFKELNDNLKYDAVSVGMN